MNKDVNNSDKNETELGKQELSELKTYEEATQDNVPINKKSDFQQARFKQKSFGKDAEEYDFIGNRPKGRKIGTTEAVARLVSGFVDFGILGMSTAYSRAGISAVVYHLIYGAILTYSMRSLVHSAQRMYGRIHVPQLTYSSLAEAAFDIAPCVVMRRCSKLFKNVVDVAVIIHLLALSCCYVISIAKCIQFVLENYEIVPKNIDVRVYVACTIPAFIAVAMVLSLKTIAPFSLYTDIYLGVIIISAIINDSGVRHWEKISDYPIFEGSLNFFKSTGLLFFILEGNSIVLYVENSMEDPKQIYKALYIAMAIFMGITMLVGGTGFYKYGRNVTTPLFLDLQNNEYNNFLKSSYIILALILFALSVYMPFDFVWYYIKRRVHSSHYNCMKRFCKALFIVVVVLSFSMVFHRLNTLMALFGTVNSLALSLIYPAVIQFTLDWKYPGLGKAKWRLLRFLAIIIFCVPFMTIGFAVNIYFNLYT